MRRLAYVLALIAIAGCGTERNQIRGAPEPVALSTNLDFEGGVGVGGRPTDWVGGGDGYELSVDTTEKYRGGASGRVRSIAKSPSADAFGTMTKCTSAGLLTGSKVTYAGFLKTADVNGWSGLWFRVDGPSEGGNPKTLAFDNMQDRPVRGTTDWTRYEIVLPVAKEAVQVCFGFLLVGAGTIWGDELSVSRATG